MKRRTAIAAGLVAVVLGGWWYASGRPADKDAGWVIVKKDDLVLGVEVTGTLRAVESSFLGPPGLQEIWDFKISSLAPEGKQVKKGEPVLGFDDGDLQRKLQEKLAEAEEARKKIEKKRSDMELRRQQDDLRLAEAEGRRRKAALKVDVPEELAASQDLHKSRLDLEQAEREIRFLKERVKAAREADEIALRALEKQRDRAESRVQEIREAIEGMTVRAPRDGTVVYVANWRDEKKKVGDSTWRGERIVEIPDLRQMAAKGEVDEADAGKLEKDQRITFRLDAHPDVEFKGKVASIWGTVQRKSWQNPLKVVRLEIDLDATDTQRMRPGMRFRGTVETGRVPAVVVVPLDAVFPSNDGPVAYRKSALGFTTVHLELGRRNDKWVEVVKGLEEGDEVAQQDLAVLERRRGGGS